MFSMHQDFLLVSPLYMGPNFLIFKLMDVRVNSFYVGGVLLSMKRPCRLTAVRNNISIMISEKILTACAECYNFV